MRRYLLRTFRMAQIPVTTFPKHLSRQVYDSVDFSRLHNILSPSPKQVPINPKDLMRDDETDDTRFYILPRFVHHIDDRARYILSRFYLHAIKQTPQTRTLDLCSSWTSHLPANFIGLVHGLGMNESELQHNPSLNDGYSVHDLNKNPAMPQFSSNSFDAVICSVSVDYLVRPLEVFQEIGRILKPNGYFITAFSNRCFPTKVIRVWLTMNEQKRVEWVANYFFLTNQHFDAETVKAYSIFDDRLLPSTDDEFVDPMYIVLGQKRST